MARMAGRVAFITGVARGQGRSHAVRLAEEGADIVGVDICRDIDGVPYHLATPADLDETIALVEKTGRNIVARQADVRGRDELQTVFDEGVATFGHIDTVIANAGIIGLQRDEPDPIAAWELGIGVLLTGVWNTIQVALPHMTASDRGGVIIATSSIAGLRGLTNCSGAADAYTAAKTAIPGLVKAYAQRLAPHNIRVVGVAPTGVTTPMNLENPELFKVLDGEPNLAAVLQNALPVHMIDAIDVSETVLFLAAESGRYHTGQTLLVDAGATIS